MNILGNVKNRLKIWFLSLKISQEKKRKKKINEEKQEVKETKKRSKLLIVIELFLCLFEVNNKKGEKKTIVNDKTNNLNNKSNNLSSTSKSSITKESSLIKEKMTNNYNKQSDFILQNNPQNSQSFYTKDIPNNDKLLFKNVQKDETFDLKDIIENNTILLEEKLKGFDYSYNYFFKYIKDTNKKIKEIEKEIKKINTTLSSNLSYDTLCQLRFNLKIIKEKLNTIKEEYLVISNLVRYSKIKENLEVKEIDEFKLAKNDDKLSELTNTLDRAKKKVDTKITIYYKSRPKEIKKTSILNKEVTTLESKKEEEEKTKKQKKEIEIDVETIIGINLILNNTLKNEEYLKTILETLDANPITKKSRLEKFLSSFLSNTINFTLSFSPLSIFKNKLLGSLVTTIMLNNNIKTMRKMVSPKKEIPYEILESKVIESYISKIGYMYINSLKEIDSLKQEITDKLDLNMNKINEYSIIQKLNNLEIIIIDKMQQLDNIKHKNKLKKII